MKKKKVILATLTAATLALGCGAFAACGDDHTHTYSEWGKNDAQHWKYCPDDEEIDETTKAGHDYTSGEDGKCICGKENPNAGGHTHAYTAWGKDDTEHWKYCPDDNEIDETTRKGHDYTTGEDGKCECGKEDPNAGGHTHAYTEWGKSDTEHWKYCPDDNEIDESTRDEHDYTTGEDGKCECGKEDPNGGGDPVSSVTLNVTTLTLGIDNTEYEDLTATVVGGGTVTWSSDNPGVVSVGEENGFVEALKPGAATITATAENGDTATCEVVVKDAYYLIGGMDSAWNKVGAFGQSGAIYFMPTETEGIYKTASTELPKLGSFQVAPVGDTSANWWQKAFNGNYIAKDDAWLSKNSDNNIAVEKHGKYTITLDLTGAKAVVSGVRDSVFDDEDDEDVYYIIGTVNNWTTVDKNTDKTTYSAFTNNGDGTYTLTTQLSKGALFKFAIVGMAWNGALSTQNVKSGRIANATSSTVQLLYGKSDYNMEAGVAGWYTFTITVEGTKSTIDYTFSETDPSQTPVETPETPEEA